MVMEGPGLATRVKMNLVICGDFEDGPFALEFDNPKETLVYHIKEKVANTLDVPAVAISLYFGDRRLEEDSSLSAAELRSGAAVLAVANPLRVTVQRYCSDIDFSLEIPRLAAPRWPTNTLFDFCLYKAGMPCRKDGKYVFVVKGVLLKEGKRMSDYKFLNNDFTISVTFIQSIDCCDSLLAEGVKGYRSFYVSPGSCIDKILTCEQKSKQEYAYAYEKVGMKTTKYNNTINFYGSCNKSYRYPKRGFFNKWKLIIQKMDGTKKIVELQCYFFTSVCELRKKVSSDKIRLTFGRTVLEDWDSKGNMMLLCNYPDIHDGATLYQVNLTGAIRVYYQPKPSKPEKEELHKTELHNQLHQVLDESFTIYCLDYIFIEDPSHFTVNRLLSALRSYGIYSVSTEFVDFSSFVYRKVPKDVRIHPSDNVISSVKNICDNCTLYEY